MASTINASTSSGLVNTADTSGILQLQTANTTALTVDGSQNIGIGTTSPSEKLSVAGNVSSTAWIGRANGSAPTSDCAIYRATDNTLGFSTASTERMRIDSAGNVGIGTTSPVGKLSIYGTGALATFQNSTTGSTGSDGSYIALSGSDLQISNKEASANMIFYTVDTERMRILSTGQVLIDRTTNTDNGKVEIYGNSDGAFNPLSVIQGAAGSTSRTSISFYRTSASAVVGTIQTTNTATSYNTSSDYRLKENIAPITDALAKVAQLKPVTYKWKIDSSDGEGFIAHELAEVCPHAVSGEKDATCEQEYEVTPAVKDEEGNITTPAVMGTRTVPVYQGIDTSFLVATLTAAIQEQQATINALTARIVALEQA
jgi:hypothetical protein